MLYWICLVDENDCIPYRMFSRVLWVSLIVAVVVYLGRRWSGVEDPSEQELHLACGGRWGKFDGVCVGDIF